MKFQLSNQSFGSYVIHHDVNLSDDVLKPSNIEPLMANMDSYEAVRNWLTLCLERDLIGPGWEEGTERPNHHERLNVGGSGAPNRYYLTGMLAPHDEAVPAVGEIPPEQIGGRVHPLKEKAQGVKTMTQKTMASPKRVLGAKQVPWASPFVRWN